MLASVFMMRGRRLGYTFAKTKNFLRDGRAEWTIYKNGEDKGIICKIRVFGEVFYGSQSAYDPVLTEMAAKGSNS